MMLLNCERTVVQLGRKSLGTGMLMPLGSCRLYWFSCLDATGVRQQGPHGEHAEGRTPWVANQLGKSGVGVQECGGMPLKRPGMHWHAYGTTALCQLRALCKSNL
ncbi:hypothetical protein Fuma_01183 [Fuerstiella marisgermanici]|uniref:Uncharacterized protein n=1 Tax=Fuerstiella marisgermanici TaxID=1891926 RepID=A0A1P8WC34_9PLAN|nr:hypothetical protein Fuma_01183 [Fuerstiella marisgermanici]